MEALDVGILMGRCYIDYAVLHKIYGQTSEGQKRYSPEACIGIEKKIIAGKPNKEHISTSYVELQKLTMRMGMRRFTNGFSKKVENHEHAVALHFMYSNFVRIHKTLKVTPAMAAGITNTLWSLKDIVNLNLIIRSVQGTIRVKLRLRS